MGATLNDDDRGPVILVACWVGFTITTVVISAKVFRRAKSGTWGHDDSTIVFTMVDHSTPLYVDTIIDESTRESPSLSSAYSLLEFTMALGNT